MDGGQARRLGAAGSRPDPTRPGGSDKPSFIFSSFFSLFLRSNGPDIGAISRRATGATPQSGAARPAENRSGRVLISPPGLDILRLGDKISHNEKLD